MRTKKIYCLFLFFSALLAFSGCSEKEDPKPLSYSQLLTGAESKKWRLVSYRILDEGTDYGNLGIAQYHGTCVADDVYIFYANATKVYEIHEGASKCNAADPDIYISDTWSVVNGTATLNFIVPILTPEFAVPFTIKTLTEDTLVVEYYFPEVDFSYRFIFNAVKG